MGVLQVTGMDLFYFTHGAALYYHDRLRCGEVS